MPWLVLAVSGVAETAWAALSACSARFSARGGLTQAPRTIPNGTGYPVRVGIGAVGTAISVWPRWATRLRSAGSAVRF